MKSKSHLALRALAEGAILVALAQVLGYLKLWRMPWGGSVTLIMLPIVLYAIRWGFGRGLLAGFVLGILQFMLDGGFVLGWQCILGDYLFAYAALGFAGLVCGRKGAPILGSLLGGGARFVVHYVTGATLWAEYMPETFFGLSMHSPWFYSLLYNLAYMLPNIALTILVFALLQLTALKKFLAAEDLRA